MALWQHQCWMLVASTLLIAASAKAAAPIELVYLRSGKAALCPDKATLETAVGKRLGYQPFFAVAERKLVAEISSKANLLLARATLVDGAGVVRGNRQLTAPIGECGELIASLALAISITLDPMSTGTDASAPPVDGEASSAAGATAEPATHGAAPSTASRASLPPDGPQKDAPSAPASEPKIDAPESQPLPADATRWNTNLGATALIGALPRAAPGFRIGVEAMHASWALAAEVTGTPLVTQAGPAGSEADLSLLFASVAPCALFGRVGACAVASLGRFRGEGRNVEAPLVQSEFYAAVGLRIAALLPLVAPLHLRLHAGSGVTLTRPTFELVGAEIFRPPLLSADAGAALGLHFL